MQLSNVQKREHTVFVCIYSFSLALLFSLCLFPRLFYNLNPPAGIRELPGHTLTTSVLSSQHSKLALEPEKKKRKNTQDVKVLK